MDLSSVGQSQTHLSGTMLHSRLPPYPEKQSSCQAADMRFSVPAYITFSPRQANSQPPEPFPPLAKWTLLPFAAARHKRGHEVCTQLRRMWPAGNDETAVMPL